MTISVSMDDKEFLEFAEFRDNKNKFEETLRKIKNAPVMIAGSLLNAVEPVSGKPEKWKIVSQEHMNDAVSLAEELLDATGE